QSDPFRTGVEGFRFGFAKYVVPFLFLTHQGLLLEGGLLNIISATLAAIIGITALAGVLQRYFFGPVQLWQMAVLLVGAVAMFTMRARSGRRGLPLLAAGGAGRWVAFRVKPRAVAG